MYVYLTTLLVSGILVHMTRACPALCTCKWKNGKETAVCVDRGLSEIPDGLDPSTQVLDFSGNFMSNLPDQLFQNKNLINLQRIYLSNCQIKIINEKTFKGLSNLVELDLSRNSLQSVPTSSFADCPSLMRLTLSSNPITTLKRSAFNHLSFLSTLELDNCKVREIEEGAFQSLSSLEWLFLAENNLKTIQASLPGGLKGIELGGNPWECDCLIKELHGWLKNANVPKSVEPTCRGPQRLADLAIKSIPDSELACLPDVSPTTFYLELAEGKNISLQCHVHSIPEASVSWWFRGQILQNNTIVAPGIHLIYFVEEGAENKRSELFIYNANSEDNGTFVCNAENPAGISQSNFTIKIIIKEDPIVIIVSFPFEYLLAALIGLVSLVLVVISLVVISIVRCSRKCEKTKSVQTDVKSEEAVEPNLVKGNSDEEMMSYETAIVGEACRSYQQEQNPDLINGHRWSDPDGYPPDYGLPKLPHQSSYYQTLPGNRRLKRQSFHNSRMRYSQEAEFLAFSSYDHHYRADVRYTADGYPASNDVAPPSSLPCCSVQWPVCLPANLHMVNNNPNDAFNDGSRRCASAQTDETKIDLEIINSRNGSANEGLTESPDEGYGGEPSVV